MKLSVAGAPACVAAILSALPAATTAQSLEPFGVDVCASCHGAHGEGGPDGVPRLAGQEAGYLARALSMFKAGTRASAVMQPIAQALGDAQIARLADHFSRQQAPLADGTPWPREQDVLAGRRLAESGSASAAPCFSCHGAQGRGNGASIPGIGGQPSSYLVKRLREFQARARDNAPKPGSMTAIAAALDDLQVAEAAAYLSQLDPR